MATVNIDFSESEKKESDEYLLKHRTTFKTIFCNIIENIFLNLKKEKKIAYTYNPLPANKREKLATFIMTYFKTKTEFARKAGLGLPTVIAILENQRLGTAVTWKKINDAFDRQGIQLPYDLKIKYKVVGNFG